MITHTLIRAGFSAAALAAGLLVGSAAEAQSPTSAQQQALRASCQSDFRANCSGVSPGGQAALACLQKNVAKLSPGCQSAVTAIGGAGAPAAAPAATPAPAPATTTTAPAAAPAPTAAPAPAKPTKPPATGAPTTKPAAAAPPAPAPAPRAIVLSPREEIMLVRQYCGADVRTFCRGVPIGGGNIAACLVANSARLSAPCRRALTVR
ncbi:hypothetical protein [Xanthobacter sp. KR7-225]|uniref:hypothetical protein n=1 Tax=Xanthobacter sp. KR7-225 TaxID=3156613 RepID=UPI0032B57ACE